MYDRQTLLLMLALICSPQQRHDKKQRKKLVLKLLSKTTPRLQTQLLKEVLDAADLTEEVWYHVYFHLDLLEISRGHTARKFDGLVIHNKLDVYPIKIHVPDAITRCGEMAGSKYLKEAEAELLEDRAWIIEEQDQIRMCCARRCSVLAGTEQGLFEVMLFTTRGFASGRSPFIFEQKAKTLIKPLKTV